MGIAGHILGLVLAHATLAMPYVVFTVLAALRLVDDQLENAAMTLGATRWRAFWRVTFPLILPAVLSGLLFAMVISFDELIVSIFLSSPTVRPVSVQMWSDVRGDVDPTIAAIGTLVLAFSVGALLLETVLRRQRNRTVGAMASAGAARMSPFVLELTDVTKRYGSVAAVDDVSLQLRKGEFLSLLGPSGSGKTTTLQMIAGLAQPSAGEILLSGRPIGPLPPYRRDIGMVFQNYALFPHMTVAAQYRVSARDARHGARGDPPARRGGPQAGRAAGLRGALSAPAVGRPAAARRARPRHRVRADAAADGRAARRARQEAARADADRDQAPAQRGSASRSSMSRTIRTRRW